MYAVFYMPVTALINILQCMKIISLIYSFAFISRYFYLLMLLGFFSISILYNALRKNEK